MSHIVHIQTQVRDQQAVFAACARLRLAPPEAGEFSLYSGQAAGLAIKLEGWRYPVVCQPDTGQLAYDNFGGAWGEQAKLDQFLQAYAVEKACLEARKQGYSVTEQQLPTGAIKLTVHAGGVL